jgi:hypothetical protein
MRRRRHQLQVSTFPFLAVLLCAMGSLILLLLVLDRRAKIVAQYKARQEAELVQAAQKRHALELVQQSAEEKRRAAERQAEWEHRQQQLHTLLAEQEQELLGKEQQVRTKVVTAAAKVEEEKARALNLNNQLQIVNARLFGSQQTVQGRQELVAKAARQTEEAQRELAQQTAELLQLEQALANLKALRERQKQTYSLVPYFGKRGDNRRPIYVEIGGAGLVFHPDGMELPNFQMTPGRVRTEVEQRIARQQAETPASAGKEPPVPYLLMLVRPDGIGNYYSTLRALAGMRVDFGYEFVESDWVFNFSGEGGPQPWQMTAKVPPTPVLGGSPPLPPPGTGGLVGLGGMGSTSQSGGNGNGSGPAGTGSNGNYGSTLEFEGQRQASLFSGQPGFPAGSGVSNPGTLGWGGSSGPGGRPSGGGLGTGPGWPGTATNGGNGLPFGAKGDLALGKSGGAEAGSNWPPLPPAGAGGNALGANGVTGPRASAEGMGSSLAGGNASNGASPPGTGEGTGLGSASGSPAYGPPGATVGGQPALGTPQFTSVAGTPGQGQSFGQGGPPAGQLGGAAASGGQPPGSATGAGGVPPNQPFTGGGPPSGQAGGVPESGGQPSGQTVGAAASGGQAQGSADGASPSPPMGLLGGVPQPGAMGSGKQPPGVGTGTGAPTGSVSYQPLGMGNNPSGPPDARPVAPAPFPGRLLPNRDWVLIVECSSDAVVVKYANQKFTLAALSAAAQGEHPFTKTVREIIARRQATVRPGEPPYRPLLRFQVKPDGLRSYYLAYPLLSPLGLPMARENLE